MGKVENSQKHMYYMPMQNVNIETSIKLPLIGIRHWQVLLLFIMIVTAFGFNVSLSVTIVAMTDPKASPNKNVPTYNWKQKGSILSSFFWGYIWPQILAGYVANRFGAKWFLIASMFCNSILTLFIPLTAARFGSIGMCFNRTLQGFSQGFLFPSLTNQLSKWVPKEERSRLGAFAFGAGPFGTVISMLLSGIISASWYGWPLLFYLYGALGLIWCILFIFFGYNCPADHPSISSAEKCYIEKSLEQKPLNRPKKVPWGAIFTCPPVWALFTIQLGYHYIFWTLLSQIPSYMDHVMNFNIKSNSALSSLPYLTAWILSFVFSILSDTIINKKLVTVQTGRKIFTSIGLLVPALALVALGLTTPEQPIQVIALLIVAVGVISANMSGWSLNHMDLAPNLAGTLMGLTNGFSHLSAILAPLIVQYLVTEESNPQQWKIVFFLASAVATFAVVIYDIFGSGKQQKWDLEAVTNIKDGATALTKETQF
ncbi:putative inorganic phosphate cotransporter isoform X2 [Anthonomus grandis grandis]|uniref:putative inorganic phosphate cotransporter isoform X2 n=1 Tax=Anthonomus grandis grandis TaxID=2921223 RepID=UPI002166B238|nr:putative inorganic phosphate cotransporter isoform X2 [Anthonomus grandis grandis]